MGQIWRGEQNQSLSRRHGAVKHLHGFDSEGQQNPACGSLSLDGPYFEVYTR